MKDEEVLLRFRLFLETQFCDDALALWMRLEHYIEYFDQYSYLQQIKILRSYTEEYIKDNAPHQIAFSYDLQQEWVQLTAQKRPGIQDISKLLLSTRAELSKELNMHTFDFLRRNLANSKNFSPQPFFPRLFFKF